MPTPPLTHDHLFDAAFALNGTVPQLYAPPTPTRIHRLTYIATTTNDVGTATITIDLEQADGTVADPAAAALATLTLTIAQATVNLVHYIDLQATYGDLIVYPGERLQVTSDGIGAAGVGALWLTVEPLGFNAPDVRSHAINGAHPGSVQLPTAFTNVTELVA